MPYRLILLLHISMHIKLKNPSPFFIPLLLSPSLNKVRLYTVSQIHHTSLSYCAATFVYSVTTAHFLIATDRLFYAMPVRSVSMLIYFTANNV